MMTLLEKMACERFWNFRIEVTPNAHLIEADVHWAGYGRVEVCVNPNAQTTLTGLGFSDEEQRLLGRGAVAHAYGHLHSCPGKNTRSRFAIMEAVAAVVEAHMPQIAVEEKEEAIQFYADLAADILLDAVLVADDREAWYADAALLHYKCKALTTPSMGLAQQFIIRMGLELFGYRSAHRNSLLDLMNSKEPEDRQRKAAGMVEEANTYIVALDDDEDLIDVLRRPRHWPGLAGKFTELFFNAQSSKTGSRRRKRNQPEDADQQDTARGGAGGGLTPSAFPKLLTQWYAARARELPLAPGQGADAVEQLPVSPLTVRPAAENRMPPLRDINWPRTLLYPDKDNAESGRLQLYWNEQYVTVPTPVAGQPNAMPDISFWVDSSESMTFEPFKKQGRYDLLLRAIFGVFRWLETQEHAPYLNYSVLNFSSETKYSGWKSWQERQAVFDALFDHQNGGTTLLDVQVMDQFINNTARPFVVVMITDGELENGRAVENRITEYFNPNRNLILIQIGPESKLSKKLRAGGFSVYSIDNAEALEGLVLREVVARYV